MSMISTGLVAVLSFLPLGPRPPESPAPAHPGPWRMIEPGGSTGCALGSPYRFFVREGADPSRLLIYFEGGGACWDFVSCSGMFDTDVADDELAGFRGIFDASRPDNPFRAYSVLFVPYCSGDVHVGDAVVSYGDESMDVPPVEHRGWTNATAALDWAAHNLGSPERIVVAGASAGSYGAVLHAPGVARRFPEVEELLVIGDSGVPLLKNYPDILERWGAADRLRDDWGADGSAPVALERGYREILKVRPDARVALLTSDHDAVQSAFYLISGSPAWRTVTFEMLRRLETDLPRIRAFVVDGTRHGLLRTDAFYSLSADGETLRDWLAALLGGADVKSRYCNTCLEDTP